MGGRRSSRSRSPSALGAVARVLAASAQSVDDFSHPGDLLRGALRPVVGDRRGGSVLFRFRLLLRRASLRVHDFAAARVLRAHRLSCRRRHNGMLASRVREHSLGMRHASAGGSVDVRIFAQALRRGQARRRAVGRRRPCAEDARCAMRRDAAAGRRRIEHLRRMAADRRNWTSAKSGAARWALEKSEPAGWRTGTLPNVRFQFRPLVTPRGVVGVCGDRAEDRRRADFAAGRAHVDLHSRADRHRHRPFAAGRRFREAAALEENEKLRTMLLSSLSHDLRTPLASITGAVTSLRNLATRCRRRTGRICSPRSRRKRAGSSRFVANLLDMSRIEAGALAPRRDLVDVAEVVRSAVERCRKVFPRARDSPSACARICPLSAATPICSRRCCSICSTTPINTAATRGAIIHARREGPDVVVTVTDEGPGVKPADLERIFEKFYRGGRPDGRKAGTGLGLSICRGLVEAMGGTIVAQSPAIRRRGTRIVLRFPVPEQPRGGKAA